MKINPSYNIFIWIILLIIGTVVAIKFVLPYFTPFIIAVIFAAIIDPLVSFLQRKGRLPRWVATALVLAVAVLLLTLLVAFGIARIYSELQGIYESFPKYQSNMTRFVHDLMDTLTEFYKGLPEPLIDVVETNQARLYGSLKDLVGSLMGLAKSIPNLISILFISFIATYFISRDKAKITIFIFQFVPEKQKRQAIRMESEILSSILGFIRAQFILIMITALVNIIGLSILGVKYAWVLGLTAGILDLMPMIGPAVLYIPWILYHLMTGGVPFAILLLLLFALQISLRQFAEAKIVGRNIGVHPLGTLMSIYIGIKLFGVNGFIIGPLALIFLKAIFSEGLMPLLKRN